MFMKIWYMNEQLDNRKSRGRVPRIHLGNRNSFIEQWNDLIVAILFFDLSSWHTQSRNIIRDQFLWFVDFYPTTQSEIKFWKYLRIPVGNIREKNDWLTVWQ